MSFSNINMLWLIWAVPVMLLVCLWGFRKRKKILTEYASGKGISAISPNISPFRRWLKIILLMVVILLTAVSLAGPQYGFTWKKIDRRGVDLVIALDCSRSMLAEDIKPNRLKRAKREVLDLLGMLQGDRVGLVAFAGTAFLQCPLTLDYEGFNLFLGALNPDFLPVGGTDLAAAINTSVSAFNLEDATDKAIILITDGEATGESPLEAAKAAAKDGIKIFSIGIGAKDGAPIPSPDGGFVKDRKGNIVLSKLDEDTLKQLATVTSGAYVRSVAGDMGLDVIYKKYIRGTMKSAELGEQKSKVFENRFQWVLALAFGLFVLEILLPERKPAAIWVLVFLAAASPRPVSASELKDALRQGESAYASGNYDAAIQHFITSQLDAPEKAGIAYNLGNARYKNKDYDGAIQAYRQVLDSKDKSLKEKALYNMGNAYYKKGDFDKAIENYKTALSLDAGDQQARENLDFVKKIKKNPPKQSSQDQQNQKNQKNQKDQKNQEQKKDKDEEKNKQDENQGKNSSEQQQKNTENQKQQKGNDQEKSQEQPSESPKQKESQPSQPEESQQQSAGQNQAATPDEESLRQAEKMLNRLQDQPGKAMMPAYGQRQVEKDW